MDTNDHDNPTTERRSRKPLRLLALLLVPVMLVACGRNDGISRTDADMILMQIDEVGARLDAVEQRLLQLGDGTNPQPAQLISEAREVSADVGEVRAMLNEVGEQLADTASVDGAVDPLDQPLEAPAGDPLTAPSGTPFDGTIDDPGDAPFDDPLDDPRDDQLDDGFLEDTFDPPVDQELGEPLDAAPLDDGQ